MSHALALTAMLLGCSDPARDAGCSNDDDCKGSRVCDDGECVQPDSSSSGSTPGECSACELDTLVCDAAGTMLSITIDSSTAKSCTGTIVGEETDPIWVHCDTSTVCVEHETECFAADLRQNGFSFTVPSKNLVVDCGG
jgi:hypothetical protein